MIRRETLPRSTDLFVYPSDKSVRLEWTSEEGDEVRISRDARVSFEGLHIVLTYWAESTGAE